MGKKVFGSKVSALHFVSQLLNRYNDVRIELEENYSGYLQIQK